MYKYYVYLYAFHAVMLLVYYQKEHLSCKKIDWRDADMVICLDSTAKCKWFVLDFTVTPISLASLKSRMVLPFWC